MDPNIEDTNNAAARQKWSYVASVLHTLGVDERDLKTNGAVVDNAAFALLAAKGVGLLSYKAGFSVGAGGVSEAECLESAIAAFGPRVLSVHNQLVSGSFDHAPPGCTVMGSNFIAHWNSKPKGDLVD